MLGMSIWVDMSTLSELALEVGIKEVTGDHDLISVLESSINMELQWLEFAGKRTIHSRSSAFPCRIPMVGTSTAP